MGKLKKRNQITPCIALFISLASSLACFSQNITTRVPEGMGMTNDFNYYVFFAGDNGRISLAKASTTDSIYICPYISNNPNKDLFRAVVGYEHGHYFNYLLHGEVSITDSTQHETERNETLESIFLQATVDIDGVIYKGYEGSSLAAAVIIKKTKTMKDGIAAEYAYIENKLGQRGVDWMPIGQYLFPVAGKYYDAIEVRNIKTDEKVHYWFDISKFFGKF